jgi:hypothetical protein
MLKFLKKVQSLSDQPSIHCAFDKRLGPARCLERCINGGCSAVKPHCQLGNLQRQATSERAARSSTGLIVRCMRQRSIAMASSRLLFLLSSLALALLASAEQVHKHEFIVRVISSAARFKFNSIVHLNSARLCALLLVTPALGPRDASEEAVQRAPHHQ